MAERAAIAPPRERIAPPRSVQPSSAPVGENVTAVLQEIRALLHQLGAGEARLGRAKRLYDVKEVAQFLGMRPHSVYYFAARRQIPGITRLGRLLLFKVVEVDEWLGRPLLDRLGTAGLIDSYACPEAMMSPHSSPSSRHGSRA